MVTELQYFAIALYLTWCLVSSLSSTLRADDDGIPLVQHRNASS
jgi:hypothetical protein